MEGMAVTQCRACYQPFAIVLRENERVAQVCNSCKEVAEFKVKEQRVLDSIKVGYLSPHE